MATFGPTGIAAPGDDYQHYYNYGSVLTTDDTVIRFGRDALTGPEYRYYDIGLHFLNLGIAVGATISAATIAFRTSAASVGTSMTAKIAAVGEDNAAAATTAAECTTDHGLLTTAQVDWDYTVVDADDSALTTIDFSTVVQELADFGYIDAATDDILINIDWDAGIGADLWQSVASLDHATYTEPTITIVYSTPQNGTATPATVNLVTAVSTPTAEAITGISPAAVNLAVTVPAAAVAAGQTTAPATVNLPVAIPLPSFNLGADITLGTVNLPVAIPAASVGAGSGTGPVTVSLTTGVPAVTVEATTGVAPSTVALTISVPAVTTGAGGGTSPATVTLTVAIPAATLSTLTETAPATVALLTAIGTPTVEATTGVSPAAVSLITAVPAVTTGAGSGTSPATVNLTITVPTATVEAITGVAPGPVNLIIGIPASIATALLDIILAIIAEAARTHTFTLEAPRTVEFTEEAF